MKKFSLPLCFLFSSCLLLILSSMVSAQISTTNYVAPDTIQPRTERVPLTHTRKAADWEGVRVMRLNQLNATEQQQVTEQKAGGRKAYRIGITRPLPRNIESLSDFTAQPTAQGTLYLLRLVSPGAKALRLHFRASQLPAGAHLFVSSRQNAQVFSPAYTDKQTDFWTPSLPGEEVIIECFVPRNATIEKSSPPFVIDAVNHIFRAPRENNSAQIESAGECNQAIPDEFREAAKATALIAFAKPDGEYVCSGTLLADVKKTGTPYFLTANHCISNGGEASSAEVYWNYDAGSFPTSEPTRWARLLVTDEAEDFTLLELGAKPPGGVVYSGWTSVTQPIGTAVTGIHHPQADYKRASFGKLVEAACPSEIPAEFCEFYTKVQWDRGITEPGSSGSGIFIGTGSQTQLVGLLSGGESSCENPTGADFYGRMNRIFGALGFYLTNGEVCRYTLLQDKFSYQQNGGNGEFTIVPKIGGENCPWQAQSNVSWITITSETRGNGMGRVAFQVAANSSDKARAGAISIAGRNVLILQAPTIAPTSPCAAIKIDFGQTVTGDLRTASCSSLLVADLPALRYAFDAEAGQSVSMVFRQGPQNSRLYLIYPDGKVIPLQGHYPTILPVAGTYLIEMALLPSEVVFPVPFDFMILKNCKYKFSATYFEVDGFGASLTSPSSFARMNVEVTGENCFNLTATPDEPVIDALHATYNPIEKAVIFSAGAAIDPKQRYIVIRIFDQPIIIRQTPRCSSATTFAYTPSELNLSGLSGTFQMQVKRTAGPSCSWEIRPYFVYDGGRNETRAVLMQPENYSNWARGTDDGIVTYKVQGNGDYRSYPYALVKDNNEVVQTITQNIIGLSCARTTLQAGQVVNGAITSADCPWSPGEHVDVYQLNVVEGEQVAMELTGTTGSQIIADWGVVNGGYSYWLGSLEQQATARWPVTGYQTIFSAGTHLLRVWGKPANYQIKVLGVGPPGCVYKINKEGDILVTADTTSFPVQLDCNRGDCDWTAQSDANWVTFANGSSGKGNQTLALALAPNTGAKRQATITIAGRVFHLTQDFSCSYRRYSTAAPNKMYASYEGGEYNYYIETGATCAVPPMTPNANWITASAPAPSVVKVTIAPNGGGFRKGLLKIGNEDFEVFQGGNDLVVTTAADYQRTVAAGSLVTLFNQGMTARTEAAQSLPLPTYLADVSILLELPDRTTRYAPLLYASPNQINFQLSEAVPAGHIKIKLGSGAVPYGSQGSGYYGFGEFEVVTVAPNVFTADSTGKGPAAGDIQRIRPGQPVVYESTFTTTVDEQGKPIVVARPISIGAGEEKTYLVLYATGVRKRDANAAVTAQIGDVTLPVEYAGAQGQFVGLDQINILLPPSLRGKGLVNITVTIEGKTTNPVQIHLAP